MRMSISIIGRLGVKGNASLADVSRMASVSVVSRRFDSSSVRRLLFPMVCKLLWPGAREGAKVKMDEPAQVG